MNTAYCVLLQHIIFTYFCLDSNYIIQLKKHTAVSIPED